MSILFLRLSLALVFIWFGLLKILEVSPVVDVIVRSFPFIIETPFLYKLLALLELAIGIGLLIPRIAKPAAWVAIVHLAIATFGVLLSPQAFLASFPFLSLVGEFVVKNLVLIAGAILIARGKI